MKLVVPERGSEEALAVWVGAERIASSLLLYPEARSALGRAARSRRLGPAELPAARALVARLWSDVDRIGLTEQLARWAGELDETHGLRADDAVHLASAVTVPGDDLVLVAADGDLLEAARAVALTTARLA